MTNKREEQLRKERETLEQLKQPVITADNKDEVV